MLRTLSIRDFVIVDRLDLEFQSGFTALTGETGAGKSILIDALTAALGERVDAGLVKEGRDKAEVSAEFQVADGSPLARYLADNDLTGEAGECWLRRVVEVTGRSRAYVNGRAASAQQLREIGEFLVDIHGQHAHQSLLRTANQRELLDGFAGAKELAARVAQCYRAWQELQRQRVAIESDAHSITEEKNQIEWQLGELKALAFRASDWEELQAEHKRLSHAVGLIEAAQFGLDTLSEADASVLSAVNAVRSRLAAMAETDPRLSEILEVLDPASIQLQEAVYGLRHYRDKLDPDPQRLRDVENRLDAIYTAGRKFRVEPLEIPARVEKLSARLAELAGGFDLATLREKERQAKDVYLKEGGKLSSVRIKTAEKFSAKVTESMQALAMAGSEFQASLEKLPDGTAHGLEQIEFLVAGHGGATPKPLAKVASGGELSRISLAIQTITSRIAVVPTLIFDEVDAGIGGRVAEIVGHMLRDLGRGIQVMCVTHLPQVAAAGNQQWRVAKIERAGNVSSTVEILDAEGRIEEIARMLGGIKITDTTRQHAAEMLHQRTEHRAQSTEEKKRNK